MEDFRRNPAFAPASLGAALLEHAPPARPLSDVAAMSPLDIADELAALGYFSADDDVDVLFPADAASPQPYISAPQSHEDWYNCHPGGMSVTCAVNARLSEYHTALYQHRYGVPVNRDLAVAALCIHEYPKAWLYAWQRDASYLIEPCSFEGNMHTHDVYVVAEMLHRDAPPELVVAVGPYTSGAAHKYTWPLLVELCGEYGIDGPDTREFRQLKNYVLAQVGQIALYETFVRDGADAARDVVRALVSRG